MDKRIRRGDLLFTRRRSIVAMSASTIGFTWAGPLLASGAAAAALTFPESQGVNMSGAEKNKVVIEDFIQVVWREGKLDRLADFWTADCVNHADPGSQRRGLEALRVYHQSFGAVFSGLADINIELQQQIAEGDRVVTQILMTARHVGEIFGRRATQREVSLATIRIDRFEHGKIAEHWSVADMAGFLQQLG